MTKLYLLIAGDSYYAESGTGNWIKTFESHEEAEQYVTKIQHPLETFKQGPRKGEVKPEQRVYYDYFINDREYDWYEIVDLAMWIYK